MTNVISGAFITSDSIGADKRGQGLMTEMTEMTMPEDGGGCGGSEGGGAGYRRKERVEITRTIAPSDHAPCLKILHSKAKWVKLDGTIVISGKAMNGNQILNNVRSD
jgi:hypothetical protein